jgi:hypothetical protein
MASAASRSRRTPSTSPSGHGHPTATASKIQAASSQTGGAGTVTGSPPGTAGGRYAGSKAAVGDGVTPPDPSSSSTIVPSASTYRPAESTRPFRTPRGAG